MQAAAIIYMDVFKREMGVYFPIQTERRMYPSDILWQLFI